MLRYHCDTDFGMKKDLSKKEIFVHFFLWEGEFQKGRNTETGLFSRRNSEKLNYVFADFGYRTTGGHGKFSL